jgi:hypothetical protein
MRARLRAARVALRRTGASGRALASGGREFAELRGRPFGVVAEEEPGELALRGRGSAQTYKHVLRLDEGHSEIEGAQDIFACQVALICGAVSVMTLALLC